MNAVRTSAARDELREAVGAVPDPEIPVLTIADLGVFRDVTVDDSGHVDVTITPTYSGCPAMDAIAVDVERSVRACGYREVSVHTVLSPAWTTDWISAEGRRKLREYGIAPPGPAGTGGGEQAGHTFVELSVRCPQCGSPETRLLSRFGSTACKALRVCDACHEPFDHFTTL